MNKNLTFLTAPITALFMPQVYRDAAKNSPVRGILYILYLALIAAVIFWGLCSFLVIPQADSFAEWAGENIPTIIWTSEGLSFENPNISQPFRLESSKYGLVAIFDMNKTEVTDADFDTGRLYITSRQIFLKKGPQDIQSFSTLRAEGSAVTITPQQTVEPTPSKTKITGGVMRVFYQSIKGILLSLLTFFVFLTVSFIGFVSNLLYSAVGLLLNLIRKNKLKYGAIFNLACFATTISFTYTCFKSFIPMLPFSLWLLVILNLVYMFFAFKITDSEVKA